MTKQERINTSIDNRLVGLETKFELFMQESHQQREDMRRLQERQDAMQAQHNAEVKGMLKHIQGLTIASMVGIGAIAVGILGFLWSTARNMNMYELPQSPPAQSMPVAPTK